MAKHDDKTSTSGRLQAISGIYAIENTVNGKRYYGSTRNVKNRLLAHFARLRRGSHTNRHLQSAWNLYGEESFRGFLIERCSVEMLLQVEQRYIDVNKGGYNISPTAESRTDHLHTQEMRRKCYLARLGVKRVPLTPARKQRLREANLGKRQAKESGVKRALSHHRTRLARFLSTDNPRRNWLWPSIHVGPSATRHSALAAKRADIGRAKVNHFNATMKPALGYTHTPEALQKMRDAIARTPPSERSERARHAALAPQRQRRELKYVASS